ncbi:helix-turn-helix transcriptional regulator [Candidatus Nitrospira inopinata]|uniref:Putative Helix-turn-helix, type 11 domain protein n=1 Tax=Candidatus Nitrospira inopinata TaxID=1715989 RepID=A0A0S4KSM4_9BACT|nr:transcriptional regulator [Candidatus Nitrospira inopinata]CUQ67468.1 putative Helix-turn-helix, type 11 domain protein [Candidatus Nitrospira inopinata]
MPRNDQITRQWHLLRLLESSAGVTLDELKARLPADYSRHLRTIRRDLEALEASGFPLVNERVDGQVRWRLMDGARHAPALSFSPTELMALVMSRALLKPLAGTHIQTALDSAMAKASSLLPPASLDYAQQLQNLFAVGLGPHKTYKSHRDTIDRLTQAIDRQRTVQVRYFSASRGRMTRREIDPYRLWYASGGLYLIGYCHLRKEPRLFAVERIRSVTLTDHPYQMPLGFDLEAFVQDSLTVMRGPRIEVELVFDKATAAWAKDRIWHPSQKFTPLSKGRLRMELQVADTRELIGWILSFGSGVRVIRPDQLKAAVLAEAKKILAGE